jgi:glutaminyl-peptide cyclotransferase
MVAEAPRLRTPITSFLATALVLACGGSPSSHQYAVAAQFPHDTGAYTQGLLYSRGHLYESTGRLGRSEIRQVDLETGEVLASTSLPPDRFGEGLAFLDHKFYQLTWKSGVAYIYDAETLAPTDSFTYDGEGWGLTTDGTVLIMSDGTATLRLLEPDSFELLDTLTVHDDGSPLAAINELEYVRGELFANVYQSDWVVRIELSSGRVRDWIDFGGLLPKRLRTPATDVLNGIAFDEATDRLLVTGKLWPRLFALSLTPSTVSSGRGDAP